MTGIERARAAKAERRRHLRPVRCPVCDARAIVVLPSQEVNHWCPATAPKRLTVFVPTVEEA